MKKILKKILNVFVTVMIAVVLIVSIFVAIMAITSKANNGVASIFGYTVQTIQSDSMKGGSDKYEGGDIQKGDVIIGKINKDENNTKEYKVGDIVTFSSVLKGAEEAGAQLVCHRIVDIVPDSLGTPRYGTQGDNTSIPDQEKPQFYLYARDVVADFYTDDYQGVVIHGVGAFLDFIRTQTGFFLVVLLPMIIFFMYELIRVVMNAMNYKKAKADEEKDEAVKAAVAEALATQNNGEKADGEASELPPSLEEMTPEQLEQFKLFLKKQEEAKASDPEGTIEQTAEHDSVQNISDTSGT